MSKQKIQEVASKLQQIAQQRAAASIDDRVKALESLAIPDNQYLDTTRSTVDVYLSTVDSEDIRAKDKIKSLFGVDWAKQYKKGDVVGSDGFMSTTMDPDGLEESTPITITANVEMIITSAGGDSSAGRDISKMSKFPNEKEVLFGSNAMFKIHRVEIIDGKYYIYMKEQL